VGSGFIKGGNGGYDFGMRQDETKDVDALSGVAAAECAHEVEAGGNVDFLGRS
jgi:hypothetical protein